MIENRMSVGSSHVQPQPEKIPRQEVCNTESSRGETRPVVCNTAPNRKKICNTEPIRGVLPPEPDREPTWDKDGYFAWEPLDSSDDSDEGERVICKLEDDYCSLMAARKEIWRSRREFKQTTAGAQTSNKPRKGQWFYVCKGDMIQHQCRRCLKQDHAASFCPYENYVPKGAKVGPGYIIVCKCCGEEGGHDDENWVGVAIPRMCWNCRSSGEHSTKDCPKEPVSMCWDCSSREHSTKDCPKEPVSMCQDCSSGEHSTKDCPKERASVGMGTRAQE
ncbi:uncharacterized protein Pyn_23115 [Prunus yedoensis var. nudiflora]|uniref:CCHC-type domain-containing protein n=1 Tax=Prunus yedoensis var. nudiflora TaxID=2094558 RepID=A0A314Y673_PRUYE|nr:uncharacterized protein Pyn_23115 [Prunus yedoensis var. nudiflora]